MSILSQIYQVPESTESIPSTLQMTSSLDPWEEKDVQKEGKENMPHVDPHEDGQSQKLVNRYVAILGWS